MEALLDQGEKTQFRVSVEGERKGKTYERRLVRCRGDPRPPEARKGSLQEKTRVSMCKKRGLAMTEAEYWGT